MMICAINTIALPIIAARGIAPSLALSTSTLPSAAQIQLKESMARPKVPMIVL